MQQLELKKKLNQAKKIIDECLIELDMVDSAEISGKKQSLPNLKTPKESHIVGIVNKINNCVESENIELKILRKTSQTGKILLPFYICNKYFPAQRLTTGDIERITSELGVKISSANVAHKIKDSLRKYLESEATRVRGRVIWYKLNRKGCQYFESLISEK